MRVLQGRPEIAGSGDNIEVERSSPNEGSYEQGYQQVSLWAENEEAGAGSSSKVLAATDGEHDLGGRVPVINTKSGRLICGAAAPMKKNLHLYLRDRPFMQVFDVAGASAAGSSHGKRRIQDVDIDEGRDGQDSRSGNRPREPDEALRTTEKRKDGESKKKSKPNVGPPAEALDHEVLSALEIWSDAIQEASEMLDKESCSSVLEELLALHERVQTKQNVGDTTSLRALIASQFPKTCLDILRSLGDFDTMRLTECVTAALNIDQQMSDGKNLGDEELSALGREKILELDRLGQRNDQLWKDFEAVRKEEEESIKTHTEELSKTKESIQELRAEEERLRQQLEKVNKEASEHLALLKRVEKPPPQDADDSQAGSTTDCAAISIDSIWKSDAIQNEMAELLKTRGSVDRARVCTNAAQDHLSLMEYVCEFSKEARSCMEAICNNELLRSIEHELGVLRHDKLRTEHLMEQLSGIAEEDRGADGPRPGMPRTSSLRDKYTRFYTEKLHAMRSRHSKSRHAACGLLSYFEDQIASAQELSGAGSDVKKATDLLKEMMKLIDALQKGTDARFIRAEPIGEVSMEKPGSTIALFPAGKEASRSCVGVISKCFEELGMISTKASFRGRLSVKGCDAVAGMDLCGMVDALHGGWGGSSLDMGEAAAVTGCVCHAVDEVCEGRSRQVVCLVPYVVVKRDSLSGVEGFPSKTSRFPLLSTVLLHTRVEHAWIQRIALIDLVQPGTTIRPAADNQILQISPVEKLEDKQRFDTDKLICKKHLSSDNDVMEVEGSEPEKADEDREKDPTESFVERWKIGMEKVVLKQIREFRPQLIVVNIDSVLHLEAARNTRALSSHNFLWAGQVLAQEASSLCSGRLVVVWDMAGGSTSVHRSVGDFVKGLLDDDE